MHARLMSAPLRTCYGAFSKIKAPDPRIEHSCYETQNQHGCENDWHRFGMNCADFRVGVSREERIEVVGRLAFLDLAHRPPLQRPYAGEERERSRFIECEPCWRLLAIRHRLGFGETGE